MKKKIVIVILVIWVVGLLALSQHWPKLFNQASEALQPDVARDLSQQDTVRITSYSPSIFAQLAQQRRVLFFDATWCSTCQGAEQELAQHPDQIPADVTVFKVDFDQEKALKQKYGVTTQHTFIQVDNQGNQVAIWNGGGINELVNNLKM